jgi:deoxyribodipyrimidine photo-lyase
MSTAIVWFRRDLRLEDNPALSAALRAHDHLVCAYIHAADEEAPWAPGAASRWWLHHSLEALDAALAKCASGLHIRSGPSRVELERLIRASGAAAVYWNRLYEPALVARDSAIEQSLRDAGIEAHSFNANLLVEPWQIQTGAGGAYRVFTPFWRNVQKQLVAEPPLPAPKRISGASTQGGVALASLRLLPAIAWDAGFHEHWTPGERGARELLRRFCGAPLADYRQGRDRPDQARTSQLSPHLHFGEIGPRQIVWVLGELKRNGNPALCAQIEAYLRELGWREFSHHLLYHFPQTPLRNLQPQFDAFPWAADDMLAIGRWQRGRTGIPVIDAGMRQLWKSGWMHNRVRMLVASFLSKNLRQHWLHGARWFWDTLVDADLANNTQGWQWTAGCGADAAPYFRIFNPATQGERFDPAGDYVRRWVPELRSVPAPLVHQPWKDSALLRRTGYPQPIVDLATSREGALAAYRTLRRTGG